MKLDRWRHIVDSSAFSQTKEFALVKSHIEEGVAAIHWPESSGEFVLNPVPKANGVRPIKLAFVETLKSHGWTAEFRTFDCHFIFPARTQLPFVVEWETGNISSSHRAINRIALAITEGRISGGVLVVPTRAMYIYLTDRVGNEAELEPYIPLWKKWNEVADFSGGYFGIVTVEHDRVDVTVPVIQKGTDGRALV